MHHILETRLAYMAIPVSNIQKEKNEKRKIKKNG